MSVGSLERQLLDSEAVCEGLRRQLDAGDDFSARETELSRQVSCVFVSITFCRFDPEFLLYLPQLQASSSCASGNQITLAGDAQTFSLLDPLQTPLLSAPHAFNSNL